LGKLILEPLAFSMQGTNVLCKMIPESLAFSKVMKSTEDGKPRHLGERGNFSSSVPEYKAAKKVDN
jgi:hypothetical protein